MWLRDLADADASCGGKAANLAKLIAADLTFGVPPGFVIETAAFQHVVGTIDPSIDAIGHALAEAATRIAVVELPADFLHEVDARAAELGPLLAVRSSATVEDGDMGAGAGVYSSRRAVPVAGIWDAIRAVWTSALTPLAANYARRRHAAISIGVIVQRFVEGNPITVYTRPPGDPGRQEAIVQDGDALERIALPTAHDSERRAEIVAALAAERAIGATAGADVEIIVHSQKREDVTSVSFHVVQARPIVHLAPRRRATAPPSLVAPLIADGRVWTWDVAHNPDPLSVAQRGLVERVDRAGMAPYALRVCAGYLYSTPHPRKPRTIRDAETLAADAAGLEARLAPIFSDAPTETLNAALTRFDAFYAIWAAELSPLIADSRKILPAALRSHGVDDPDAVAAKLVGRRASAIDAMLVDVAMGVIDEPTLSARLGVMAPAWDVCVPTFAERPALVREAIERARLVTPTSQSPAMAIERRVEREIAIARVAAELAERDDLWFARAQWLVRRALLARAREANLPDADIFWLPLDAPIVDLDDARRRAAAARSAAERAARWDMPTVVNGPPPRMRTALCGVGTGSRVTGRVVRFASLASAITVGRGDVIVVRAVTPALAVLVVGCAALVSETGGLLDHGAALARELGIPCVVGCHDAWAVLADGMLVTVHGDAGTVTTTGGSAPT